MKARQFIQGAIGLCVAIAGTSLAYPLSYPNPVFAEDLAIATPHPGEAFERRELSRSVAHTMRRTFRRNRHRIGNISNYFGEQDQTTLGTLDASLANAVVRDARARLHGIEAVTAPDPGTSAEIVFDVERVEPVTWNECFGGSGPSRPLRGICPDIDVSGWRMVVVGGPRHEPFRLVYYIPQGTDPAVWTPQPDGLQSIPESVQTRILAAAAEEAGVPASSLRVFWVDARFFDRDFNPTDTVGCGSQIRSGWAVQILGSQATPSASWGQPLWVYHTNMTGTDVRLIGQGEWAPPPMAPPAMP